jgi:hypothetical protein
MIKGTESIARKFRTLKIPMPLEYTEFFPFLYILLQHSPVTPTVGQKYIHNLIVTISLSNKRLQNPCSCDNFNGSMPSQSNRLVACWG